MRIIAGEFRSRRLQTLPGLDTRPTPDRLRESLFSILHPRLPGCVFIDAYAGSGAVGLEALSRGARRVVLLEKSRPAAAVLKENIASLGVTQQVDFRLGDVLKLLPQCLPADIVFLDPPYEQTPAYERCLEALAKQPPGLVIVQHAARQKLPEAVDSLRQSRTMRQGDNMLTFYEAEEEQESA